MMKKAFSKVYEDGVVIDRFLEQCRTNFSYIPETAEICKR